MSSGCASSCRRRGAGWALLSRGGCGSCPPCATVPSTPHVRPGRFFDASQREPRLLLHARQGSLLQELSTAAFQSPCESVTRNVPLSLIYQPVLSLPGLPQLQPRALAAVAPLRDPKVLSNPDKGHFSSVDSFIWQFKAQAMAHIQPRSHGNESPLGSVTLFSGYQSNSHLQPERLATLTVEGCRLAFVLMFIHLHQFNPIQSNCASGDPQLQVVAASQVSAITLAIAAPLHCVTGSINGNPRKSKSNNTVSTYLLLYIPKTNLPSARYYGFQ